MAATGGGGVVVGEVVFCDEVGGTVDTGGGGEVVAAGEAGPQPDINNPLASVSIISTMINCFFISVPCILYGERREQCKIVGQNKHSDSYE